MEPNFATLYESLRPTLEQLEAKRLELKSKGRYLFADRLRHYNLEQYKPYRPGDIADYRFACLCRLYSQSIK